MTQLLIVTTSRKSVTINLEGNITEDSSLSRALHPRILAAYGEFSLTGEEFIVSKPDTPRPWRNELFNNNYVLSLGQNGIGYSRITNSHFPLTINDRRSGRFIYIRDNDSGEFWNATWFPSTKKLDEFRATHRPGSTEVFAKKLDISIQVNFTVLEEDLAERWQIEIENTSKHKRRLSVFIFVRWDDSEPLRCMFHDNSILAIPVGKIQNRVARYLTADHAIDSFDCDEEQFIGRYGNDHSPKAVEDGKCSRSVSTDKPVGVLQKNIAIGAGTKTNFSVLLGALMLPKNSSDSQIIRSIKKTVARSKSHQNNESINSVLERTLSKVPDPDWNKFLNTWAKYQSLTPPTHASTTAEHLRYVQNLCPHQPEQAVELLRQHLSREYRDGLVTQSSTSTIPDQTLETSAELLLASSSVIKETGQLSLLNEHIDFFDSGSASILEHIIRACKIVSENLQPEEISSVVNSCRQLEALKQTIVLLTQTGEHQLVRRLERIVESSTEKIARRVTRAKSIELKEITAAINSGVLSEKQQNPLVKKLLSSARDLKTLASLDETHGQTISFKLIVELIEALLLSDQTDVAQQLIQRILPQTLANNPEQYQAEPYLFPYSIFGPTEQRSGQASFETCSLSSGQFWQILTEKLLGLQPTIGGLKIDPHIPRNWRQFDLSRTFRGATYHIRILNPVRVTHGVDRLSVNGLRVTGNVIRPFQAGNHFVEVILG